MADKGEEVKDSEQENTKKHEAQAEKTVFKFTAIYERWIKNAPSGFYLIPDSKDDAVYGSKDKDKAKVEMYVYTDDKPPPDGGTYIVLQFATGGEYFAAVEDYPEKLVLQTADKFDPENPKDITNPTDRRMFKITPYAPSGAAHDTLIESMFAPGQMYITLPEDTDGPARLRAKGNPPLESQLFQFEKA